MRLCMVDDVVQGVVGRRDGQVAGDGDRGPVETAAPVGLDTGRWAVTVQGHLVEQTRSSLGGQLAGMINGIT